MQRTGSFSRCWLTTSACSTAFRFPTPDFSPRFLRWAWRLQDCRPVICSRVFPARRCCSWESEFFHGDGAHGSGARIPGHAGLPRRDGHRRSDATDGDDRHRGKLFCRLPRRRHRIDECFLRPGRVYRPHPGRPPAHIVSKLARPHDRLRNFWFSHDRSDRIERAAVVQRDASRCRRPHGSPRCADASEQEHDYFDGPQRDRRPRPFRFYRDVPTYLREGLHYTPKAAGFVQSFYGAGALLSIFGGWFG